PGYPSIEVAEGTVVFAQFDGTQFSVQREVEMPMPEGVDVIDPEGNSLPKEKAVAEYVAPIDDKINKVVSSDWADPVLHQDVSSSAVVYGSSVDAYGWSFAMKARQNISKIFLKIQTKSPSVHQRVIVRENDHLGTILVDKSFTKSLNSLVVADFDFID